MPYSIHLLGIAACLDTTPTAVSLVWLPLPLTLMQQERGALGLATIDSIADRFSTQGNPALVLDPFVLRMSCVVSGWNSQVASSTDTCRCSHLQHQWMLCAFD